MSYRIDQDLKKELNEFGLHSWNDCFHCGNCTAICPLSSDDNLFPRRSIRVMQMGLKDKLASSVDPWLCYYCGECSETCPRDANPGEVLMILRRYLTSLYDWTGLSGVLFKSLTASIIAFVLVAILVIAVSFAEKFNTQSLMHLGHNFEMFAILIVFLVIIVPNIIRMWWLTIVKPKVKVPASLCIKAFTDLIVHMFTQKRALDCEDNKFRWLEHLLLVFGYLLLLFVTVFLDWFATESTVVIWSGYIISAAVFIITFDFVLDRIKKNKEVSKFSHPSDWFFVIWLFLMSITAFAVRIFVDTGLIENNIWLFLVHIIILAQWALIIVPFGKWTHFLYRSFAIYFNDMIKAAQSSKTKTLQPSLT